MEHKNLATKIFSETCCGGCSMKSDSTDNVEYESKPIDQIDSMGRKVCHCD